MLPLLLSSAVVATPTAKVPTPTPIDQLSWVTTYDYPKSALRQGAEGTVGYRVAVDASGKVVDCQITDSSGQPTLDQPTCDLMLARGHFAPATDAQGKPVVSTFTDRIRWKLPAPPPPAPVMLLGPGMAGVRTVQDAIASLRFKQRPAFALPVPPQFDKTPQPGRGSGGGRAAGRSARAVRDIAPNGLPLRDPGQQHAARRGFVPLSASGSARSMRRRGRGAMPT